MSKRSESHDPLLLGRVTAHPVTCSKGHQVYVMYFLEHKKFGFGCGTCSTFSLGIQHSEGLIEITVVNPTIIRTDA